METLCCLSAPPMLSPPKFSGGSRGLRTVSTSGSDRIMTMRSYVTRRSSNNLRTKSLVVCMAPEEEKMTRRSPLDFPMVQGYHRILVYEFSFPCNFFWSGKDLKPGRRPDIFPQFSPMKTPLPPPLPADPPEEDEEEEEEKKEEEEDTEKEHENPNKH